MSGREIFAGVRADHPDAIMQINHARGRQGVLSRLMVDTDTFASHRNPADFRMATAADATASDTRLFDANFDAFEIQNGLVASKELLNDWMTMLSSGRRKVATAVSDSHNAFRVLGGYSRTFVGMGAGKDDPAKFLPSLFTGALKELHAMGSNGPFMTLTARRLDSNGMPTGDAVEMGGTVSLQSGESMELTVDVQAPEWMKFSSIELYTHADGREALNGEPNGNAPIPVETADVTAEDLNPEPVPGLNGFSANRIHVVKTFTVTPTADTWYLVILKSSSGVSTLYPLAYDGVTCSGNICTATAGRPYAFTNPIFVDADGSGAYDTFPQKVSHAIRISKPAPAPQRVVPTLDQWLDAWRKFNEHRHE